MIREEWDKNLAALREDGRSVDLVVFTGDLRDWGHETDYAMGVELLQRTCQGLAVPLDRLFVVPGNHDIARKTEEAAWKAMREEFAHAGLSASDWMAGGKAPAGLEDAWRDAVLQRRASFWKAVVDLGRADLGPSPVCFTWVGNCDYDSRREGRRMSIRTMTEDDWPQVWPFFDEIVQAGETYAYPLDLTSEQAQALWTMSPPGQTVVLEEDGQILGSATMGPNRPARGSHVGTASFMVSSAARGRGVGRRLGEYVVQWHRDQGYRAIQFNAVVETNTAAVHLWQALGFRIIGTVPATFDSKAHGLVGLHVMYLPLD